MITYNNVYSDICDFDNLVCAWKAARKGKTKKEYAIDFEKDLEKNLLDLQFELKNQFYKPKPLTIFIIRDPKTRVIAKSDFRDRIVHHALVRVIEPIFDKTFIHDSCANRKGRGTLFAVKQFDKYKRKVSHNGERNGWFNGVRGYCFKADIKHYFQEIDHEILLSIIKRKITDEKTLWLTGQILQNNTNTKAKGMPLGNLTSQIFANIYLNELDQFVKHKLKAKFYIRYVDDFVLLSASKQECMGGGGN